MNRVLVFGPPKSGKKSLVQTLCCDNVMIPETSSLLVANLPIETKYYAATLQICIIAADGKELEVSDNLMRQAQAVLLVFDIAQECQGLAYFRMLHEKITAFDPAIKLVIANSLQPNPSSSLVETQEWCLNNGFEFIEYPGVEKVDADSSQRRLSHSLLSEEKTGLARLIEALSCHMWPVSTAKDATFEIKLDSNELPIDSEGEDKEFSLEKVDELFSQVIKIRQEASSLPDVERRERAAQMMVKLMQQFDK